jgi:hypothetical protein
MVLEQLSTCLWYTHASKLRAYFSSSANLVDRIQVQKVTTVSRSKSNKPGAYSPLPELRMVERLQVVQA